MVLPQSDRGDRVTFPALKRNVFILEGLNGFASSIYFNYLFFFLRDNFGFGAKGNLLFCAANGLIYAIGAFYGGKIAQRSGYFRTLKGGWTIMVAALVFAALPQSKSVLAQFIAMVGWTIGVCVTWPCLEALSCEGESGVTLPRKVGIYNFVWSIAFAFGLFSGGSIIERFGWNSMFVIPATIHLIEIAIVSTMNTGNRAWHELSGAPRHTEAAPHEANATRNKMFLRMAWLANPFAYIAMNTVIPLIPQVAASLHLSKAAAGVFCSIWMFARTASFIALWKWTRWHYRFGWLIASYALMIGTFAAILLLTNFLLLVAAQILFGFAVGLIYYSSLFYSMDASDTKGEHGGVHEAAIGAGIFGGPAIGYTALQLFPEIPNGSVTAVSVMLTLGLAGLFYLRRR
jgi:predicted MFS family arabinose efflux permease